MDVDDPLDVGAVAPAHRHRDRQPAQARPLEHPPVALGDAGDAQREPAEPVAFVDVGPGEEHDEVGLEAGRQRGERGIQRIEVGGVAGVVGQVDVEVALAAVPEREVARAVDRQREHRGVVAQDLGGAVALVHVEVNDGHPPRTAFGLHQTRGHRHVVEAAEPLATVGAGVVSATGQIRGRAVLQRRPAGGQRRAHRSARALHHRGRPRETDLPLLERREPAQAQPLDPVGGVAERQHAIGGGLGLEQLDLGQVTLDPLAQQPVLGHREAVPIGQRQHEPVAVEGFHRARLPSCCSAQN